MNEINPHFRPLRHWGQGGAETPSRLSGWFWASVVVGGLLCLPFVVG